MCVYKHQINGQMIKYYKRSLSISFLNKTTAINSKHAPNDASNPSTRIKSVSYKRGPFALLPAQRSALIIIVSVTQ